MEKEYEDMEKLVKHIALYRIENGTVLISRIVDARQDYLRILFGEDYLD